MKTERKEKTKAIDAPVFKYINNSEDIESAIECPFCGEINIRIKKDSKGYHIGCISDGCIGNYNTMRGYKTKEDALKAWNRRDK